MRHHSSITAEDREFVETWENVSDISVGIASFNPRGEEGQVLIAGGRRFMCTTEERLVTQDKIADVANDPFLNGTFRPILVPETVTVQSNPNALSDAEILDVLKSTDLAWDEWMKVLDSPATLQRLLNAAEEANTSLRRFREVEARLEAVKPKTRVVQKDRSEFEKIASVR